MCVCPPTPFFVGGGGGTSNKQNGGDREYQNLDRNINKEGGAPNCIKITLKQNMFTEDLSGEKK